jgi:hypothetical protein
VRDCAEIVLELGKHQARAFENRCREAGAGFIGEKSV